MSFKENDRIQVTAEVGNTLGMTGKVTKVYPDTNGYLVEFDGTGRVMGLFESEITLLDPKREALITLAETLDSARKQANAINGMDGTVYQSITTPLISVLDALVPSENVGYDAYEFLIEDCLSVREALNKVGK